MITSSCPHVYCNDTPSSSIDDRRCNLAVCNTPFDMKYCSRKKTSKVYDQYPGSNPDHLAYFVNEGGTRTVPEQYEQTEKGYVGTNPLLTYAPTGQIIPLDRPHSITDVNGNHHSSLYNSYEDISLGDIRYWIPQDAGEVLFNPVFTEKATIERVVEIDPMGNARPEYKRTSDHSCFKWDHCDSFTSDQIHFRENLIHAQSRKRNEQNYLRRWY